MLKLFWTPLAINFFIELLMVALLTGYFAVRSVNALRTRVNSKIPLFLLLTFGAASGGTLLQFLAIALHPDDVDYALPFVNVFGVVAMLGFLLFALYFQRQIPMQRWAKVSIFLGICLLVATESVVAIQRILLLKQGVVEYRDYWLSIPYTVGFFAVHGILLVRLVNALSQTQHLPTRQCMTTAFRVIVLPSVPLSTQAAALRAFFYVTLLPAATGLVLLARGWGWLDWRIAELMNCWLILFTYVGFTLVYINHTPEYSSFQFKLVGITLAAVLSILSGISWIVSSAYVEAYDNKQRLVAHTAVRFAPNPQGGYTFQPTIYHFQQNIGQKQSVDTALSLPFDFPFYGKTYQQLFPNLAGMVGLESVPRWRDVLHQFGAQPALFPLAIELREPSGEAASNSGLFYHATADVAIITWRQLVSQFATDAYYTFQLCLYPNGVIEMVYADLPETYPTNLDYPTATPMLMGIVPAVDGREIATVRFNSQQPFNTAPLQGLMEYPYMDFRVYLNRIYQPIAIFILCACFAILLIFPRFFHVSLNRPLQTMLQGVRAFKAGNLSTTIRVSYHDEIGFLAASFNDMAAAQRELIETLEAKVAARSAEVAAYAARNARLEERNHLTRELHDTVSQTLFSANLIADTVPDLWQKHPARAQDAVHQIRQLNKNALLEMQNLLMQLRPEGLAQHTFGHMLQKLVNSFSVQHRFSITLEITSDVILPPKVQLVFLRIAQEALHNIVKHAQADHVLIHFDGLQGQGMLSISDDGRGFAQEHVAPSSFGLRFMQERMEQIGGMLEIDSILGGGTTLTAIWFANQQTPDQ